MYSIFPAVCTPECKNGGQCLSFNVCQCPQDFRGNQCQYSVDVCSPKKIVFNGAFNCSGDNEHMRCALSCPNSIEFDGVPAPQYTCAYEQGVFLPALIPQCKYRRINFFFFIFQLFFFFANKLLHNFYK